MTTITLIWFDRSEETVKVEDWVIRDGILILWPNGRRYESRHIPLASLREWRTDR